MAEARTAAVAMTSFLESTAVASSVSDEMARPRRRLNADIQSLTAIEAASTSTTAGPKSTSSGWKILSAELVTRLRPMAHTRTATTRPARYS